MRRLGVLALSLSGTLALLGCPHSCDARAREADRILTLIAADIDPLALAKVRALPPARRWDTARRTQAALRRVKAGRWRARVTDVVVGDGQRPATGIYTLGVGTTELLDCDGVDAGGPRAQCRAFAHAVNGVRIVQQAGLEVALDEPEPRAFSPLPVIVEMRPDGAARVSGRVSVDAEGVRVRQAVLRVPRPLAPSEHDGVRLRDFELTRDRRLRTFDEYVLDVAVDVPAALRVVLGGRERVTLLGARAAVELDVDGPVPLARMEGELVVLDHYVGRAFVEYGFGSHVTVGVSQLRVPTPIPGVEATLDGALVEIELRERRLRVFGQASMGIGGLVASQAGGSDDGWQARLGRLLVDGAVTVLTEKLGLPHDTRASAHIVVDWDDPLSCADFAAQGHSLLRAVYVGRDRRLELWAPKSYAAEMPDGLIAAGRVLKGLWDAPWTVSATDPLRCYPADPGPIAAVQQRLLGALQR